MLAAVGLGVAREDDLLGLVARLHRDRLERRRQEERERAALARLALHMDLAAEQACDLTADREAEARAAVAAARRAVGLLERLGDQAQLVVRDADAGVADRELEPRLGACERLACELASLGHADAQLDATLFGELERVREQVLQHLLQALLVGLDRRRDDCAVDLDLEGASLVLRNVAGRPPDEL